MFCFIEAAPHFTYKSVSDREQQQTAFFCFYSWHPSPGFFEKNTQLFSRFMLTIYTQRRGETRFCCPFKATQISTAARRHHRVLHSRPSVYPGDRVGGEKERQVRASSGFPVGAGTEARRRRLLLRRDHPGCFSGHFGAGLEGARHPSPPQPKSRAGKPPRVEEEEGEQLLGPQPSRVDAVRSSRQEQAKNGTTAPPPPAASGEKMAAAAARGGGGRGDLRQERKEGGRRRQGRLRTGPGSPVTQQPVRPGRAGRDSAGRWAQGSSSLATAAVSSPSPSAPVASSGSSSYSAAAAAESQERGGESGEEGGEMRRRGPGGGGRGGGEAAAAGRAASGRGRARRRGGKKEEAAAAGPGPGTSRRQEAAGRIRSHMRGRERQGEPTSPASGSGRKSRPRRRKRLAYA